MTGFLVALLMRDAAFVISIEDFRYRLVIAPTRSVRAGQEPVDAGVEFLRRHLRAPSAVALQHALGRPRRAEFSFAFLIDAHLHLGNAAQLIVGSDRRNIEIVVRLARPFFAAKCITCN